MHEQFLRTEMVLGQPALERLQSAHVAVFGLGGVGSYTAEILARSGVGELTLVDQDTVSVTNINRQLCALHSTVGQSKAEVTARRCRDISPSAVIHPICATYDAAHREDFFSARYDYIADCIDLVTCKLDLIQQAMDRRIPILSALGTGNKLDPTLLRVPDISQTSGGPLARVMRKELRSRPPLPSWRHPPPAAAASLPVCHGSPPPPVSCWPAPLCGTSSDEGRRHRRTADPAGPPSAGLESGRSVPWHLRPLLSVQDRAGQGRPLPGGDGAAAAPAGSCLDSGAGGLSALLEGPALRQPEFRFPL